MIASTAPILTLGGNRLSILIFHRVLESKDFMRPVELTSKEFDKKMQLIAKHFNPVSLSAAVDGLKKGCLPKRPICVTFDDGYKDNAEVAYPILKKWNIPATFFVASGFLNDGRMWNDTIMEVLKIYPKDKLNLTDLELGCYSLQSARHRAVAAQSIINNIKHLPFDKRNEKITAVEGLVGELPMDLMMTEKQVRFLSQSGMEIGAHTVSHPILSKLSLSQVEDEIKTSKSVLEGITGTPIDLFAYPNGKVEQDYLLSHAEVVKKLGFKAAVSTNVGVSCDTSDLFQLKRFTPWDRGDTKFLMRLVKNLNNT